MNKSQLKKEIFVLINTLKQDAPNLEQDRIPDQEIQHFIRTTEALYRRIAVLQYLHQQDVAVTGEAPESKTVPEVKKAPPLPPPPAPIVQEEKKAVPPPPPPAPVPTPLVNAPPLQAETPGKRKGLLDLKTIVTLNEKFIFTNQLFKGNVQEYNDAIGKLNSFQQVDEAKSYLAGLKARFSWDPDHETTQHFIQLVERSFTGQ